MSYTLPTKKVETLRDTLAVEKKEALFDTLTDKIA